MSKKILLHVGLGKTGTTSIQTFLTSNRDILAEKNCYFANFLGPDSQIWLPFISFEEDNPRHTFAFPFISESSNLHDYETRINAKKNKISQLHTWIDELPASSSIIFSCEWLIDIKQSEIKRLKEILNNKAETNIIIYLREPISHTLSAWTQHTANGFPEELTTPTDFLKRSDIKSPQEYIENWEYAFPKKVIIRRLDKNFMINQNLLEDFCFTCGIPWDKEYFRPTFQNTSLNWQAQKILSGINMLFPWVLPDGSINTKRGKIVDLLHKFGDEKLKYIPSKNELVEMNEFFQNFNKWLHKTYFPNDDQLWSSTIKSRKPKLDKIYSPKLSSYETNVVNLISDILEVTHWR